MSHHALPHILDFLLFACCVFVFVFDFFFIHLKLIKDFNIFHFSTLTSESPESLHVTSMEVCENTEVGSSCSPC